MRTTVAFSLVSAVALVAIFPGAVSLAGQAADSEQRVVVVIRDAEGQRQGLFEPRPAAYTPEVCCPFKRPLRAPGVAAADGRIVSGFGYYAWTVDGVTHLRVLALVARPGAPNEFMWGEEGNRLLQPREIAKLELALGETVEITAMKALGLEPASVTLEPWP